MVFRPVVSRRGVIAALGGGVAATGAAVLRPDTLLPAIELTTATSEGAWPVYKRDVARTGYQPRSGPRQGLSERWRSRAGSTNLLRPGLSANTEYICTGSRYATQMFQIKTGSLEWQARQRDQFAIPGELPFEFLQSGPTIAGNRVFTVSDVTLYERAVNDGTLGWALETNSGSGEVLPVGNVIFAGVSLDSGFQLLALDQNTGLRRWAQPVNQTPLAFAPQAQLLITGAYAIRPKQSLVARDPMTGNPIWQTPRLRSLFDTWRIPAIAQGRIYAGWDTLYAFDVRSGTEIWKSPLSDVSGANAPVTDGEKVYVQGSNKVVALDAKTGRRSWTTTVSDSASIAPPILTDTTMYLPLRSEIVALRTDTGAERFRYRLPATDALIDALISVNGDLFVRIGQTIRALTEEKSG